MFLEGSDIGNGTNSLDNWNFSPGSTGSTADEGFPRGRGGLETRTKQDGGSGTPATSQRNKVFRTAATVAPENLRKLEVSLRTQVEGVATIHTYVRLFDESPVEDGK